MGLSSRKDEMHDFDSFSTMKWIDRGSNKNNRIEIIYTGFGVLAMNNEVEVATSTCCRHRCVLL